MHFDVLLIEDVLTPLDCLPKLRVLFLPLVQGGKAHAEHLRELHVGVRVLAA